MKHKTAWLALCLLSISVEATAADQDKYKHFPMGVSSGGHVSNSDPYKKIDVYFSGSCDANMIDVRAVSSLPLTGSADEREKLQFLGRQIANSRKQSCKNPMPAAFRLSARERDFNAPEKYMMVINDNGVVMSDIPTGQAVPTHAVAAPAPLSTPASNSASGPLTSRAPKAASSADNLKTSTGLPIRGGEFNGPRLTFDGVRMIHYGPIDYEQAQYDHDLIGEVYVTESCNQSPQMIRLVAKGDRMTKGFYLYSMEEKVRRLSEIMRMRCNDAIFPVLAYAHKDSVKKPAILSWNDNKGWEALSTGKKVAIIAVSYIAATEKLCRENPKHPSCQPQATITKSDEAENWDDNDIMDHPIIKEKTDHIMSGGTGDPDGW